MSEANGALAQPLELANRSLLILYGTETGHSQEIAEELADMALRLRFELSLEEMDGVDLVSVQAGSNNSRPKWPSKMQQYHHIIQTNNNKMQIERSCSI